jgi:hypothetical protein
MFEEIELEILEISEKDFFYQTLMLTVLVTDCFQFITVY